MNVWVVFPASLLHVKGMLFLPYVAVPFYLYALYVLITKPDHRKPLIIFFALTLISSITMVYSLRPPVDKVVSPLLLLLVMFMPLIMLIYKMAKADKAGIIIWSIVSVAGWLHSLGWSVWFFALAGS